MALSNNPLRQLLQRLLDQGKKGCWLFLALNICFWGLLGGGICLTTWALMGMPVLWDWLLCAIGYPAILLGLWGGVIFLYVHTEWKD